jgi:tetratricopeptide (TPR) repeat protein
MSEAPSVPAARGGRRRLVWGALLGLALVGGGLGVVLALRSGRRPPPVPSPDLTGADPAISAAVGRARARAEAEPRSADAWGHLGMVLLANSYTGESVACFTEAERLDAGEPRWPYYRGVALLSNSPHEAALALRRAVERSAPEEDGPRLRLAEVLLDLGRTAEAEPLLRQVLAEAPDNARAHLDLGLLLQGRSDGGLDHLRRAAAAPATARQAHTALAEAALRGGDREGAERERRRAAESPASPPLEPWLVEMRSLWVGRKASLARASEALQQGRAGAALGLMRQTVQEYPADATAWTYLGRGLLLQGQPVPAEQALRQAVEHGPDLMWAHFYLGVALLTQGRPGDAAGCFRTATRLKPADAGAWFNLGLCLQKQGRRAEAADAFRTALRYKPDFLPARTALAELLLHEGRRAEAVEQLEAALRLKPDDAHARGLLEKARSSTP